jgi:hypothetical protein
VTGLHPVVVAGMGHPLRRDDGVGPLVADRVAAACGTVRRTPQVSDPLDLFGWWDGADLAVVVDAACSGAPAGTVAVEGTDFGWGEGLSPAVAAAVPGATARVLALVEGVAPCA